LAKKNLFAQKIDPIVEDAISSYKRSFTKPQLLHKVMGHDKVARVVSQAYMIDPSWDINLVLQEAVRQRINRELGKKRKSGKLGVSVRVYENYALDGQAEHRWQKLDIMNIAELQICIRWRQKFVESNLSMIKVYKDLIQDMIAVEAQSVGEILGETG
tara:strand:+ start:71 stop:544 length:474 start_codon:yes stop_codon:yes gene_type:complete